MPEPDPQSDDYYKVLGVNREASASEVAKASAAFGLHTIVGRQGFP